MEINSYHLEVLVDAVGHSVHGGADVVQHAENAGRSLALDQVAHHLVVEVVDVGPFDVFLHVLLLKHTICTPNLKFETFKKQFLTCNVGLVSK